MKTIRALLFMVVSASILACSHAPVSSNPEDTANAELPPIPESASGPDAVATPEIQANQEPAAVPEVEKNAESPAATEEEAAPESQRRATSPRMSAQFKKRSLAFVSKKASEATLKFSHYVLMDTRVLPTSEQAKEHINSQVQHLFGPMERGDYPAVPKEDHKIKIKKIEPFEGKQDVFKILYDYTGTIVVQSGPRKYLDILLPKNPSTIYEAGMRGRKNVCTDSHYQEEGDFWYFWNPAPYYPNCKLEKGVHYDVVRGEIERQQKSKTTYPEYHRLVKDGAIDLYIFIGMDDPANGRDPMNSKDVNAVTYQRIREFLMSTGYQARRVETEEIKKTAPIEDSSQAPYFEEFTKEVAHRYLKVRVQMMFGEMGINEESLVFHHYFKQALEQGSFMIYDGHSGLGGNLDLAEIQSLREFKIQPAKNRYQIYFFNSCTSYTYYNALYFQRKRKKGTVDPKGTKNLDILANGLSTEFDSLAAGNVALIRAIDLWASRGTWTSYQKLARSIDSENLFTVNGDEDNPTSPVRE